MFSADDSLSSLYSAINTVLSTSSVEPQAETNLIEHQTAHNVLRHLIIADGKRQKNYKQNESNFLLTKFCFCETVFISALVSTLLTSIPSDKLRAWILCNRGCFIFVM